MSNDKSKIIIKNQLPCISRKSFILGGIATMGLAGLGFVGCNSKNTNGVMDVGVANCVDDFDLLKDTYPLIVSACWHVFESLYRYDWNKDSVVPVLAKSLPKKIDKGVYEVTIDTSKKFSNGDNITVKDVSSSLAAVKNDVVYSTLFSFYDRGNIVGEDTIRLYLNSDIGGLLEYRLCLLRVYKTTYENDEISQFYGSGPWIYESGDGSDNSELTFVKNDFYKGDSPAGANKMVWHISSDDDQRIEAALNGDFDVVERVKPDKISELESKGYEVANLETSCMPMLAFNTTNNLFKNVKIRQALLYAININTILADLLVGYGNKATSIVPEYSKYYARAKNVYNYDPKKARDLLDQAGVNRFKFDLLNFGEYWGRLVGAQIVKDLNTIGVTCNFRESDIDWNDFSTIPESSDYEVALIRSDPSYFGSDPDVVIEMLWGDGIGDKLTGWSDVDPENWNRLESLAKSAREASSQDRMTYWSQCYDLISEHVPMYPLCFRNIATGWRPDLVKDFTPIPLDGVSLLGSHLA